jgi:uncharacterized protein
MLKTGLFSICLYVLLVPLGIYIMLCLFLFFFQSNFIYFPAGRLVSTPQNIGLDYDPVKFGAADGVELSGWFVPGSSSVALLFCHGNAGNISHRLESLQVFNGLGLNTLIFDYRGYGESKGRTTESGTYLDAEAAWNQLVELGYPADKIVIFGRSLGGAVAAHIAMQKQPAALILESTFTSIPDLGARLYPIFPVRLLSRFKYNTVDFVRRVQSPVLVIHSSQDDIVPYDLGRMVYQAAGEPKEFLQIEGDHNSGFVASGEKYLNGLRSFISKYVIR